MAEKEAQHEIETADDRELARIGYKQELKRDLTLLQVSCNCARHPLFIASSHALSVYSAFFQNFGYV